MTWAASVFMWQLWARNPMKDERSNVRIISAHNHHSHPVRYGEYIQPSARETCKSPARPWAPNRYTNHMKNAGTPTAYAMPAAITNARYARCVSSKHFFRLLGHIKHPRQLIDLLERTVGLLYTCMEM